jgi:hypothetical protein
LSNFMVRRFILWLRSWLLPKPKAELRRRPALEPLENRIAPATFVNGNLVTYIDAIGDHVSVTSSLPIFTKTNFTSVLTFVPGASMGEQLQLINLTSSSIVGSVFGDSIGVIITKAAAHGGSANVGEITSGHALGHITVQGDLGAINAGVLDNSELSTYYGLLSLNVHSMGADGVSTQGSSGSLVSTIHGAVGTVTVQGAMDDVQFAVVHNDIAGTNGTIHSLTIGGSLEGNGTDNTGMITADGAVGSIKIGGDIVGGAGANSGSIQVWGQLGSLTVNNIIGSTGMDSGSVSSGTNGKTGTGSGSTSIPSSVGGIKTLTVHGNLQGGAGANSGSVAQETAAAEGTFGTVKVGGGILGGSGDDSGRISANGLGSVTVGQGVIGSAGQDSGTIASVFNITKLSISGGAQGAIVGGSATGSGAVTAENIGLVTIHGDITGLSTAVATITGTGQINASGIGQVTIYGSLVGSAADHSGALVASANIFSVTFYQYTSSTGSIFGGSGTDSGQISANTIGNVTVAGKIAGSSGSTSGAIVASAGSLGNVTIAGGGLLGGSGANSGEISGSTSIGSVHIAGQVLGQGDDSGAITSTGAISNIYIGLGLDGGAGVDSGRISATGLGSVTIGQGVIGSSGQDSGTIASAFNITKLSISGSAQGAIVGGSATGSGAVTVKDNIGTVTIHGDITGLSTAGATTTGTGQINASSIGKVTIYGSLVGSAADQSGAIVASTGITSVTFHQYTSSTGSILGGSGTDSGQISADTIGPVSVAGKIAGSSGSTSGAIIASAGSLGNVTIAGGGLAGGSGANSGEISGSSIGAVHIAGQVLGLADDSGVITSTGAISNIYIGQGLNGGAGTGSGSITVGSSGSDNLGSLIVKGGITGSTGDHSGEVTVSGAIGSINLYGGALAGSGGAESGAIIAGDNIGVTSLGSIRIGAGSGSGQLSTDGNLASLTLTGGSSTTALDGNVNVGGASGTITIHGDITGTADNTGEILVGGNIARLTVTGALLGGTGANTGSVIAGFNGAGSILRATVGDIVGNAGQGSGMLGSDGALGIITVAGNASGVTTHGVIGGTGANSGEIYSGSSITSVTIKGDLQGSGGDASGAIISNTAFSPSGDVPGNINAINIIGSITGGAGANSGQITSGGNLGIVTIGKNISSSTGDESGSVLAANAITSLNVSGAITGTAIDPVIITAVGQVNPGAVDLAIGHITVGHDVAFANILAGYGADLSPVNGAASIGTVVVGGDWSGSNLIAGAAPATPSDPYGGSTLIDSSLVPTIASIIIKGHVDSASAAAGTYGFISGKIDSFSLAGALQKPPPATITDVGQSGGDTVLKSLA